MDGRVNLEAGRVDWHSGVAIVDDAAIGFHLGRNHVAHYHTRTHACAQQCRHAIRHAKIAKKLPPGMMLPYLDQARSGDFFPHQPISATVNNMRSVVPHKPAVQRPEEMLATRWVTPCFVNIAVEYLRYQAQIMTSIQGVKAPRLLQELKNEKDKARLAWTQGRPWANTDEDAEPPYRLLPFPSLRRCDSTMTSHIGGQRESAFRQRDGLAGLMRDMRCHHRLSFANICSALPLLQQSPRPPLVDG